jgi:predicted dehydrogenase
VPSPMTLSVDATIGRLIREKYLGRLLAVEIRANSVDFVDLSRPPHWRESREFSGNNILSLGIWYEALMRWLGPATEVTAMGRTFVPMRTDGESIAVSDIPDHLDVIAHLACGAQAHMQLSSVTGVGGTAEAYIFGTDGTLKFAGGKLFGSRRGDRELLSITIPPEEAKQWRVEEEFINAIRGIEMIRLTDFATGLRYMEFTDAVGLSLRSGRAMALPLGYHTP